MEGMNCLYIMICETEICVRYARLCAPVHESVSVDDAESLPLNWPVEHSVHLGSSVVLPPVSVNLPAVHLVCSAASQGACGCGVGWKR